MGMGLAIRCFNAALKGGEIAVRLQRALDGIKDPPVIKEIIREVVIPQRGTPPPREIIREVPVEVIKEVQVEVVREVIKEVPVEVIKEVKVEVIKEVIKEVPVEVIREIIKEVPVEVVREVVKEVPVEVFRDMPRETIKETIREIPKETVREVIKRIPDLHGPAQLLALLQQDGRLIDFLYENIDQYDDERVGAAAREIHARCRKSLLKHVSLEPVRPEREGELVTLGSEFDASEIRVTGGANAKNAMFGTLKHRGWKAARIDLPERPNGANPAIVMPAEVEVE